MARINIGVQEDGTFFTAAEVNEIVDAVNNLGTAADVNTGNSVGQIPLIGEDGTLPLAVIPGGGSAGTGDVTGPASTTDGLPVLFNGTSGKSIKAGTAQQIVPTDGEAGEFLQWTDGVPTWGPAFAETPQDVILGRITASTGAVEELTAANVRTIINVEDGSTADQTAAEMRALMVAEADATKRAHNISMLGLSVSASSDAFVSAGSAWIETTTAGEVERAAASLDAAATNALILAGTDEIQGVYSKTYGDVMVWTESAAPSSNIITVDFATIPSLNQYRSITANTTLKMAATTDLVTPGHTFQFRFISGDANGPYTLALGSDAGTTITESAFVPAWEGALPNEAGAMLTLIINIVSATHAVVTGAWTSEAP